MSDSNLEINCWILGDPYYRTITVNISRNKSVSALKSAIKTETNVGVGVNSLILYGVSILCDPQLAEHVAALELDPLWLNPVHKLSEVFADGLPQADDHVHVVVELLPPSHSQAPPRPHPPSKKRKLDYGESEYNDINIPPSAFAKPSTFRNLMMERGYGRDVYIHNRPINFKSVPLTLISPIFGRFSDGLFTNHGDLLSQDFAPARDLANTFSVLEEYEASRKKSFLSWLLDTLPDIEGEESSHGEVRARLTTAIIKGDVRDKKSDFKTGGHVELGDNLLLVVEVKPELGEEFSDPHWQMMAYIRAYYMQDRCYYRVGQSPLPAILIALYGPCIDASAAIVCPDGSVQVEALTPALRVDCDCRDDRQRNLLAGFVRALRNAFDDLKTFYESPSGPIPDPCGYRSSKYASIDRPFPYKVSYTNVRGIEQAFKYRLRLTPDALIFLAEHTGPNAPAKSIAVKFTRTYSKDVHKLLAGEGFAPELFAVEDLAGGWKMVVMEYLSDWEMLELKPHEERQKYKEKLRTALGIIHGQGFVHGDVRGPNILVREDDVKVIDFDHCGKEGEQRYQREWDHRRCPDDAKEGDLMRMCHDDWMFERIFDNYWSSRGRRLYLFE